MAEPIGIEGIGTTGSYQVDDKTKATSLQHHKDTYDYNIRHAEDHLKAAREVCQKLEAAGKAGEVETPKSLLDLFKYFEDTKNDENAANMPMDKLKDKIKGDDY
jgi:hypothetical protein